MRMFKILATSAVAATLTLGMTAGVAEAREETSSRAGFGTYNVFAKDNNTLVAQGKANAWRRKVVLIQRARRGTNNWRTIARDRTTADGSFRTTLQAGSDIPCNGRQYKTRAKKKGRPAARVDDKVWSC